MSEYTCIRTVEEADLLDKREMYDGYWSGYENEQAPGSNKSKSFWHGWRNGQVAGGWAEKDDAQIQLDRENMARGKVWLH